MIGEALDRAKEVGLDLETEVAPNAKLQYVRLLIMENTNMKFKKSQSSKEKTKNYHIKGVKIKTYADKHDYDFKMKNAKKFISKGDKVKFTIRFKGREMDYMKAAYDLVDKIIEDTKDISKVEQKAKMEGRQMTMIIQPN